MKPAPKPAYKPIPALARRSRGIVLIMYSLMLTLILAFAGLVLDMGLVYLRRAQLQAAADSMAISAASMLDGTANGLASAAIEISTKAKKLHGATASDALNVLRFSADPHAPADAWLPAGAIGPGAAASMTYARIDIGAMGAAVREMQPLLMGIFGGMAPFDVRPVAVAGRRSLNVTPLAICARNTLANGLRSNKNGTIEQVAHGFRYGITYNLINMNPIGTDPLFYYVDPLVAPGAGNGPAVTKNAVMAPFMCSGTLAYPRIGTGSLRIARQTTFGLAAQLNSRFNQYGGSGNAALDCTRDTAPPDTNIKSYAQAGTSWHYETPVNTSAASKLIGSELATVADLSPGALEALKPAPTAYGVRWAFRIPRKPGNIKFTGSWDVLYPSTSPYTGPKSYPSKAPYFTTNNTAYATEPVPLQSARPGRRLMYIPLLACTTTNGPNITSATVLGYGMFFLTAPASSTEVPGEFAGIVSIAEEGTLMGDVELIR